MSYEKLTIVDNLGQDPELRYLQDGTAVTNLSVAVNKKRQGQKTTAWYRVSVWNGSEEQWLPCSGCHRPGRLGLAPGVCPGQSAAVVQPMCPGVPK